MTSRASQKQRGLHGGGERHRPGLLHTPSLVGCRDRCVPPLNSQPWSSDLSLESPEASRQSLGQVRAAFLLCCCSARRRPCCCAVQSWKSLTPHLRLPASHRHLPPWVGGHRLTGGLITGGPVTSRLRAPVRVLPRAPQARDKWDRVISRVSLCPNLISHCHCNCEALGASWPSGLGSFLCVAPGAGTTAWG